MKKTGFTLSELVIAISIVGVAAAFVVPVVGKFMPDKKKSNVLKYYTMINATVVDYYNNDDLYRPTNNCKGLSCFQGDGVTNNFREYLITNLNLVVEDGDRLVTPDGIGVTISESLPYEVKLDMDLSNNASTTYSGKDRSVANTDTFTLVIDEDGEVTGGDALTFAYLKNPYKRNDREHDVKVAEENACKWSKD